MDATLKDLVEARITRAQADGVFDCLPGQGMRLDLNEAPLVPEAVRVGNRIMKNAGVLPPEVAQLKEAAALEQRLAAESDGEMAEKTVDPVGRADQARTRRRLQALTVALRSRGLSFDTGAGAAYRQAIVKRLTG